MSGVLVDSNVLIDLMSQDPTWLTWSSEALRAAAERMPLVINPIIYAEISTGWARIEALDATFPSDLFRREPLPYSAAFLAGKAFATYRRRGGTKRSPMPDFLIGAHAAVAGYHLLTRDVACYATYFPTVRLISPQR